MSLGKRISYRCYRIIRGLVWLFYPKTAVEGMENLPDEPCVIVSNHCQMRGPIICELYLPGEHDTWCAAQMMHMKEVPAYAFDDFWRDKPGYIRWFYKLLSYVIAPFSVCVFTNTRAIGVYHDARIMSTFRKTVERLQEGANIVIMPEGREAHNHIVNDLQEGFIDVARIYKKRTGRDLCFVPMYIAPSLRKAFIGKPTHYSGGAPAAEEKQRVKDYLMSEITGIAVSLPKHRVTPYGNMPRKDYPYNKT